MPSSGSSSPRLLHYCSSLREAFFEIRAILLYFFFIFFLLFDSFRYRLFSHFDAITRYFLLHFSSPLLVACFISFRELLRQRLSGFRHERMIFAFALRYLFSGVFLSFILFHCFLIFFEISFRQSTAAVRVSCFRFRDACYFFASPLSSSVHFFFTAFLYGFCIARWRLIERHLATFSYFIHLRHAIFIVREYATPFRASHFRQDDAFSTLSFQLDR